MYFASASAVANLANSLGCNVSPPKLYHEVAPFICFPAINNPIKESIDPIYKILAKRS